MLGGGWGRRMVGGRGEGAVEGTAEEGAAAEGPAAASPPTAGGGAGEDPEVGAAGLAIV